MSSLGLDFGTSGARAIAVNPLGEIEASVRVSYDITDPASWETALWELLAGLPVAVRRDLQAIAIDATSATVLLCDAKGDPVTDPLLYGDDRGVAVLPKLQESVPPGHVVLSATSSLCKLSWWLQTMGSTQLAELWLLHQADWLAFHLHGQLGISDYHNALKLGYDPVQLAYPHWMADWQARTHLPKVLAPGFPVSRIRPAPAKQYGIPAQCVICAGTTDSNAAFLAGVGNDATEGTAMTALGSTLVLKILSDKRVEDALYGVYSHRFGDRWLVGGASNTGGAVLKAYFSDRELADLSTQIDPTRPSGLNYYPLLQPGERFPVSDRTQQPQLSPRPADPAHFLHGLLEGIAQIEARGYALLQELGTNPVRAIYTTGGGAANATWTALRSRLLGMPLLSAVQTEAAYGAALLARTASGCSL